MSEAKKLGFKLKVHADEIESFGGAELAVELGEAAEHLMAISEQGIEALAKRQLSRLFCLPHRFFDGTAICTQQKR